MEKRKQQNWLKTIFGSDKLLELIKKVKTTFANKFNIAGAMSIFIILLLSMTFVSAGNVTVQAGDFDIDGNLTASFLQEIKGYGGDDGKFAVFATEYPGAPDMGLQINNAIADVAARGGGLVKVPVGTWYVNTTIQGSVSASKVIVEGSLPWDNQALSYYQNTGFLPTSITILEAGDTSTRVVYQEPTKGGVSFRNIYFKRPNYGTTVFDSYNAGQYFIENCLFYGSSSSSSPLIRIRTNSNSITVRNSYFNNPYGTAGVAAVSLEDTGGSIYFDRCSGQSNGPAVKITGPTAIYSHDIYFDRCSWLAGTQNNNTYDAYYFDAEGLDNIYFKDCAQNDIVKTRYGLNIQSPNENAHIEIHGGNWDAQDGAFENISKIDVLNGVFTDGEATSKLNKIDVLGNVTATYFIGDGSYLTGISADGMDYTNLALTNKSNTFTENQTTTKWWNGLFNWTISSSFLSWTGSVLGFDSQLLNDTIDDRAGSIDDGVYNSTAWNRSGTNVILHHPSDKVGVGITPVTKLHLFEDTDVNGSVLRLQNDYAGDNEYWDIFMSVVDISDNYLSFVANGITKFTINRNGNVYVTGNMDATGKVTAPSFRQSPYLELSANYTITDSDGDLVLCDSTAGNFTVILPTRNDNAGRTITFLKVDNTPNLITLDGEGAELIQSAATFTELDSLYDSVTITPVATGFGTAGWYITARDVA